MVYESSLFFFLSGRIIPRRSYNVVGFIRISSKEGCKAKIHAALSKDDPMKIVVTMLIDRHNHEIGQHLYKRYPQNRALTDADKADAEKLSSLNIPYKNLRKELQTVTGKSVTLQDVVNIKKAYRRKEKEAISGGQDLNAAQLLHKKTGTEEKRRSWSVHQCWH